MKNKTVYIVAKPNRPGKTAFAERLKGMSLQDKAWEAMKAAVRGVVEQHKKTGRPLAVWKNGKVAYISPYSVK